MNWFTVLRIFIIFQGTLAIGLATVTAFYYFKVFVKGRGILPEHVLFISAAHIMLMIFALNEIRVRLPLEIYTWRIPYLLIAFLLSDVALYILSKFEYNRYKLKKGNDNGLRK